MKNIILIDDLSNKGWKSVLEKSVIKQEGVISAFSTFDCALKGLATKADLIFLDIRLTEEDHNKRNISEMSGFQLLKKIKEDFLSCNFSTPIILLTASNKIWIIEEFRQLGIDAFYIKEHPDSGFSKEYSRENLERLQSHYLSLILKGEKRNKVWKESFDIINKLKSHKYFKEIPVYLNIQSRIIDKLKLGYANLFSEELNITKSTLKIDNESLAFIIFWSILEEIVKGYSDKNNWDKNDNYSFTGTWKFRNNESFIQKNEETVSIGAYWDNRFNKFKEIELSINDKDSSKYIKGLINLSEQVYTLFHFFGINEKPEFKRLNEFRNEIDYIHSSVKTIYQKPLITSQNHEKTFENILKILKIISSILDYPK